MNEQFTLTELALVDRWLKTRIDSLSGQITHLKWTEVDTQAALNWHKFVLVDERATVQAQLEGLQDYATSEAVEAHPVKLSERGES